MTRGIGGWRNAMGRRMAAKGGMLTGISRKSMEERVDKGRRHMVGT